MLITLGPNRGFLKNIHKVCDITHLLHLFLPLPSADEILISGLYLYSADPIPFNTFNGNIYYLMARYEVRPDGPYTVKHLYISSISYIYGEKLQWGFSEPV